MAGNKNYLDFIKGLYKGFAVAENFMKCAGQCRVVHVDEGRVKVEMDVKPEHMNSTGTLHGGLTATLIDVVTTTAIMATKRREKGASVNLNISYLAPATVGETLVIDGYVTRMGKRMAFANADVWVGNKMIATGSHVKALPKAPPESKTTE